MTDKKEYPPPFSLRLTFKERQILEHNAGNMPISAYIREQLFDAPCSRKRHLRQPVKNEKILAQLLSELGQSHLSNNLNQLAKASHIGSLPLTLETEQALNQAADDIKFMRHSLVKALGLQVEGKKI